MALLSWLIYIPLQIALIPLAILGGGVAAYKQLIGSKRIGVSQSAVEILDGRWAMHRFGMRRDDATAKLAATIPNHSAMGVKVTLFPLWLKYKIAGKPAIYPRTPVAGSETVVDMVTARTFYFDGILNRTMADAEQFVALGAGYDTRAYENLRQEGIKYFEVDQESLHQHKKESVKAAGIEHDHVTYVSVDFTVDSFIEKLVQAGFDVNKKTVFLWEGVTLYLSEADVRKTLQAIRDNAVKGSALVADVYGDQFLKAFRSGKGKSVLEASNEGLAFALDYSNDHQKTLSTFIESEAMTMGEACFLGSNNEKGPFMAVVEILI